MVNILSATMQYDNRKGLRITKLISKLKTLEMTTIIYYIPAFLCIAAIIYSFTPNKRK